MDTGTQSESSEPVAAPSVSGLPPEPRNKILQTLVYMRDPFRYHARCMARYGDLYTIPSIIGTVVMTAHPDGARALFNLDAEYHEPFAVESVQLHDSSVPDSACLGSAQLQPSQYET